MISVYRKPVTLCDSEGHCSCFKLECAEWCRSWSHMRVYTWTRVPICEISEL